MPSQRQAKVKFMPDTRWTPKISSRMRIPIQNGLNAWYKVAITPMSLKRMFVVEPNVPHLAKNVLLGCPGTRFFSLGAEISTGFRIRSCRI